MGISVPEWLIYTCITICLWNFNSACRQGGKPDLFLYLFTLLLPLPCSSLDPFKILLERLLKPSPAVEGTRQRRDKLFSKMDKLNLKKTNKKNPKTTINPKEKRCVMKWSAQAGRRMITPSCSRRSRGCCSCSWADVGACPWVRACGCVPVAVCWWTLRPDVAVPPYLKTKDFPTERVKSAPPPLFLAVSY